MPRTLTTAPQHSHNTHTQQTTASTHTLPPHTCPSNLTMKSHTTAVLLATAACLAVLAHPAAAGCDKVVQAGEVVHYKSMDANSYCFNGTAMPSGMNGESLLVARCCCMCR